MSNPLRIVDFSKDEFIEIPSDILVSQLYKVIIELEKERDAILTELHILLRDIDTTLVAISSFFSGKLVRGNTANAHILFERLKQVMLRVDKMYTIANNFSNTKPPIIVRMSIEQAQELEL